jgi:hypothetical protein
VGAALGVRHSFPDGHAVQDVAPPSEYVPLLHGSASKALGQADPAGHEMHSADELP